MHIDEATDCDGTGHLIAYVRYVVDTAINDGSLLASKLLI
jgi:hypothetical protein